MRTISPEEARARFGELTSPVGATHRRVHRPFEDQEGYWRPMFDERMQLVGYNLFPRLPPEMIALRPPRKA